MLGGKNMAALKRNETGESLDKAKAFFLNGFIGEITQV